MSILRYKMSQRRNPLVLLIKQNDIAGSPLQELLSAQPAVLTGLIAGAGLRFSMAGRS
jgi:hypothetical protein